MAAYYILDDGRVKTIELPEEEHEVLSGVRFGRPHVPFTPAFWLAQAYENRVIGHGRPPPVETFDIGHVSAFCLLGGHGITAELATAAYNLCMQANLIDSRCSDSSRWASVLERSMNVNGRRVRYRFPRQKGRYLAALMSRIAAGDVPSDGLLLRDWLLASPGIGYKTAGWIVRNLLDDDRVAIVDVHLYRAMVLCGVFPPHASVVRSYLFLEQRFIEFSRALGVRASELDLLVWQQMRAFGRVAIAQFAKIARGPSRQISSDPAPAAA